MNKVKTHRVLFLAPLLSTVLILAPGVSLGQLNLEIDKTAKTLTFTGADAGNVDGFFGGTTSWTLGAGVAATGTDPLFAGFTSSDLNFTPVFNDSLGGISFGAASNPVPPYPATLTGSNSAIDYSGFASVGVIDAFTGSSLTVVNGPGNTGFENMSVTFTAVPEASEMAILLVGSIGLLGNRRRKRAAA